MKILYSALVCTLIASSSLSVVASSVTGQFADQGYVGSKSGTLTLMDAQNNCLEDRLGSSSGSTVVGDFEDQYKLCMKDFVPFKTGGHSASGSCGSETVNWGTCSATIGAGDEGSMLYVGNQLEIDDFEGSAAFRCNSNKWEYLSGGCGRVAYACEPEHVVDWPVTTPDWADDRVGTEYTDKYGDTRHNPKANCEAKMPYALSGKFYNVKPTSPETDSALYEMELTAPYRCFNDSWLNEPLGAGDCEYIPKKCAAKEYNYDGCGYSITAGAHDEILVIRNPTPSLAEGSVEAYCWDGEWEVKSESCELSCAGTFGEKTWLGTAPRTCAHGNTVLSTRIAPNTKYVIDNEIDGMVGAISYLCSHGDISTSNEYCEPKDCTDIGAATWGDSNECSHEYKGYNTQLDGRTPHGDSITINSERTIVIDGEVTGETTYMCQYGEFETGDQYCSEVNIASSSVCENIGSPLGIPVITPMLPGGRVDKNPCASGWDHLGGLCCRSNAIHTGSVSCQLIQ
tara:strand:+ start:689 stop:2224 length:1536 start_codon:yes stop_codon:yes gene_type:complete